jgi:drug/metabolite transporter (DMT)-like permease
MATWSISVKSIGTSWHGTGENPRVVVATVLALVAAVLHAGWNLVAKRSADPFIALWGQFLLAAVIGAVVLAAAGGIPAAGWAYATVTGAIHVPYLAGLAHAYDRGDFSLAYPIARGGGALLAGIGGIVLLGDELDAVSVAAIVTVVAGMMLLAAGAAPEQVSAALFVAVTIGAYTINDSHASRELGGNLYPFAVFAACGLFVSLYGTAIGRAGELRAAMRIGWRGFLLTGAAAVVTYWLVMLAVQRAPVGYVAALRESSVVLAAFVGTRYLSEAGARRRTVAATIVVAGLVLLVASAQG